VTPELATASLRMAIFHKRPPERRASIRNILAERNEQPQHAKRVN
jgi:hypothetical protein